MIAAAHSKKITITIYAIAFLFVLIIGSVVTAFWDDIFGPPKYFAVELVDGDKWYGQLASESDESITLDHVYHFHDGNLNQLVSHSDRLNPPQIFARSNIVSLTEMGESNPVLKAIREYEGE